MARDTMSAAWDGKGHSKHIGKRSLLGVGGLICMAQANQIEAPIYIPARFFDMILVRVQRTLKG